MPVHGDAEVEHWGPMSSALMAALSTAPVTTLLVSKYIGEEAYASKIPVWSRDDSSFIPSLQIHSAFFFTFIFVSGYIKHSSSIL